MLTGKHLIAGNWVETEARFQSRPSSGAPHDFCQGTPALVEAAAAQAEDSFASLWRPVPRRPRRVS